MTVTHPTGGELLNQLFSAAGRPLDARQREQFLVYLQELRRWNRTLHLTSITDTSDVIRKHFLGSLDFLRAFVPSPGMPLLDVGTGAGFPGIVLKLWHPELAVDLAESSRRKSAFLRYLCHALEVGEVRCLMTRVEDLAHDPAMRERYAVVVSRGVGGLRRWLPATLTLVQAGGRVVLEKGPGALAEVRTLAPAMAAWGGALTDMLPLAGASATQRTLVVITKVATAFDKRG